MNNSLLLILLMSIVLSLRLRADVFLNISDNNDSCMTNMKRMSLAYLGICDPPFVLPTEAEVSLPIISEQQFFHCFQESTRQGK